MKINKSQSGNSPQDFAPDGSALYFTTDDGSEFSYLMKYTIADESYEKAMERDWDISGSYFTDNGTYQVTYINEDAKNTWSVGHFI